MSFLNGADLRLSFKPATAGFMRQLAHARKMDEKRARSPSRILVRQALSAWRQSAGLAADSCIYPSGVDVEDFTSIVNWSKAQ